MKAVSGRFLRNKTNITAFHREHPFEKRKEEANRILKKYPERVPIIVQKTASTSTLIPDVDKKKYLVPRDLSVGQFMYVIRKRIKLEPEQSIFVFVNDSLPPSTALISQLYQEQKDKDGFLYMEISGESTFG